MGNTSFLERGIQATCLHACPHPPFIPEPIHSPHTSAVSLSRLLWSLFWRETYRVEGGENVSLCHRSGPWGHNWYKEFFLSVLTSKFPSFPTILPKGLGGWLAVSLKLHTRSVLESSCWLHPSQFGFIPSSICDHSQTGEFQGAPCSTYIPSWCPCHISAECALLEDQDLPALHSSE